jgi:hypothetical protein
LIPFAVNAAFAIELYLKTLGFVFGRKMHGHDLLKLFDKLPDEAKQLLRQEVDRSPATEGIKDIDGFRVEIGRVRNVFEEWRYLHERSTAPEIRFHEFLHVLSVLHNACRTHEQIKRSTSIGMDAAAAAVPGASAPIIPIRIAVFGDSDDLDEPALR